jgi:hypothetical protein
MAGEGKMIRTGKIVLAISLLTLATTAHADQKVKTKSNIKNDRMSPTTETGVTADEISLVWGSDTPTVVHVQSGTATPVSGTAWSLGSSNSTSSSMANGKVNVQDISMAKRPEGPGSVSLNFGGSVGGTCPLTYDAVSPVKGVGVVIKKNPGGSAERTMFDDVTVAQCDASGVTFSYGKASWNVKENVK